MARGSTETKQHQAREAEAQQRTQRRSGFASRHRAQDKSYPLASPAECVTAERRFRNAKQRSMLFLASLLGLGVVPICMPATPLVIGGVLVTVTVIVLTLVLHNREHRAALVAQQVAKGMSQGDAHREYSNKYSGD